MQIAKLPSDEELRLQDLFSYDILDTEAEGEFNDLVELAGQICNCPISMITFIDKDRQWFKARLDPGPSETSRDIALCAHAILKNELTIVEDTLKDERFVENPLVTAAENPIRFYAGAPIVSPGGFNVGTICVINNEPQKLTPKQERALAILSGQVTRLLELRVRNKYIRSRAETIINLKDKSLHQTVDDFENQKQKIAETLHEQIAQEAAACKMYLMMAETEQSGSPYIQKANVFLESIINDLRKLSNSISPSILSSVSLDDLLHDYLQDMKQKLNYEVYLETSATKIEVPIETSVWLFRITERWMKLLQQRKDVKKLIIYLTLSNPLVLSFEDDGTVLDFQRAEKDIITTQIDTVVNKMGGVLKIKTDTSSGNCLTIEVPV